MLWGLLRDSDPLCEPKVDSNGLSLPCRSQFHPQHHPGQGFVPFDKQREVLDDDHLTTLIWGGYRASKSRTASLKALETTLAFFNDYHDRAAGQVAWIVGSTYEKTRAEFNHPDGSIYGDLQRTYPVGLKQGKSIDPGEITLHTPCPVHKPQVPVLCTADCARRKAGTFTIRTKSADHPDSLGMESPIWIIIAEAAHTTHDVYLRCVSRVSEARSKFPGYGMLILEGTADTNDASLGWYAQLWKEGQLPEVQESRNFKSFSIPSHANTFVYPGGDTDPEILKLKAEMPADRFSERHLGVPVPPSGRVFTDFNPLVHIQPWKYRPDLPVYVGIDPGYSGQPSRYAVEVAQIDEKGTWRFFDEIYTEHTKGDVIADMCTARWWWGNPDKKFVIDIAGAAETGVTETHEDIWRKKIGANLGHQRVEIMKGIMRMASMLRVNPLTGMPGVTFDPTRNRGMIAEMGGGLDPASGQPRVYSWMKNSQGEIVGKTPHDRYCDAIKAATYLMVAVVGYVGASNRSSVIKVKRRADLVGATR